MEAQKDDFQCYKWFSGCSSWISFCCCDSQTQVDVEWNPAESRSMENECRIVQVIDFSVEQPNKREGSNTEDSQNKCYSSCFGGGTKNLHLYQTKYVVQSEMVLVS